MSLKAFHVVFIAASASLAGVMAAWALGNWRSGGGGADLAWGVGSAVAALVLGAYGVVFVRKLRHISYL
jgi:steroid 5-alpha reductase family enzyme